ncbi:hypothetical protein C0995_016414, partial [Termitomyces sp. Mi166
SATSSAAAAPATPAIPVQGVSTCIPPAPGANYDPWWDMPQLIAQTKDAIKIFEAKESNGIAVFNSTAHLLMKHML